MSASDFAKSLPRILVYEGGKSNNPKDPGGARTRASRRRRTTPSCASSHRPRRTTSTTSATPRSRRSTRSVLGRLSLATTCRPASTSWCSTAQSTPAPATRSSGCSSRSATLQGRGRRRHGREDAAGGRGSRRRGWADRSLLLAPSRDAGAPDDLEVFRRRLARAHRQRPEDRRSPGRMARRPRTRSTSPDKGGHQKAPVTGNIKPPADLADRYACHDRRDGQRRHRHAGGAAAHPDGRHLQLASSTSSAAWPSSASSPACSSRSPATSRTRPRRAPPLRRSTSTPTAPRPRSRSTTTRRRR